MKVGIYNIKGNLNTNYYSHYMVYFRSVCYKLWV